MRFSDEYLQRRLDRCESVACWLRLQRLQHCQKRWPDSLSSKWQDSKQIASSFLFVLSLLLYVKFWYFTILKIIIINFIFTYLKSSPEPHRASVYSRLLNAARLNAPAVKKSSALESRVALWLNQNKSSRYEFPRDQLLYKTSGGSTDVQRNSCRSAKNN